VVFDYHLRYSFCIDSYRSREAVFIRDRREENEELQVAEEDYNCFRYNMQKFNFVPDKIDDFELTHVAYMSNIKTVYIKSPETPEGLKLNFSDILDFEIIENGRVISTSASGAAIAGGLLFGVVGAVVGSTMHDEYGMCGLLQIRIVINNISHPNLLLTLIAPPGVPNDCQLYYEATGFAKEVVAALTVIKNQQNKAVNI
jgi:hypothetical protein